MSAPRRWWWYLWPSALVLLSLALLAWLTTPDSAGVPFIYTLF